MTGRMEELENQTLHLYDLPPELIVEIFLGHAGSLLNKSRRKEQNMEEDLSLHLLRNYARDLASVRESSALLATALPVGAVMKLLSESHDYFLGKGLCFALQNGDLSLCEEYYQLYSRKSNAATLMALMGTSYVRSKGASLLFECAIDGSAYQHSANENSCVLGWVLNKFLCEGSLMSEAMSSVSEDDTACTNDGQPVVSWREAIINVFRAKILVVRHCLKYALVTANQEAVNYICFHVYLNKIPQLIRFLAQQALSLGMKADESVRTRENAEKVHSQILRSLYKVGTPQFAAHLNECLEANSRGMFAYVLYFRAIYRLCYNRNAAAAKANIPPLGQLCAGKFTDMMFVLGQLGWTDVVNKLLQVWVRENCQAFEGNMLTLIGEGYLVKCALGAMEAGNLETLKWAISTPVPSITNRHSTNPFHPPTPAKTLNLKNLFPAAIRKGDFSAFKVMFEKALKDQPTSAVENHNNIMYYAECWKREEIISFLQTLPPSDCSSTNTTPTLETNINSTHEPSRILV
eukprot:Nk52_evm23s1400 gene=Nk52_evmTU23s1400